MQIIYPFHHTELSLLLSDMLCFILYNFYESIILSCEFSLSEGKNLKETLRFQPRRYVSISLHLHCLICKLPFIGEFRWRQKCHLWFLRCLPFWTPCLFWDFLSFTSDFLFQLFNAGKIWEMLQLNKVTHRALRQHNLIFLVSFVLLLSPKQSKCLTSFHLQLIGGIWLAQKFAFNIDKFQ